MEDGSERRPTGVCLMNEGQKTFRIRKALESAERLGFKTTRLMLEGLQDQLRDFEPRSTKDMPQKVRRILTKVHLIEQSMKNESAFIDEKEVNLEAKALLYQRIGESVFFNFVAGGFFYMLPEFSQTQNTKLAFLIKVGAFFFFGLKFLKDIRDVLLEETDYSVEGMKWNILELCESTKAYMEKAIDDMRDILDEVPPI